MRRPALVAVLALALVLAGCSGFVPGDETPTATVTPAAVPTDQPTATSVPRLAPGLSGSGVTDGFALRRAHANVLENTSFRLRETFSATYRNGTDYRRFGIDARFSANESRYYVKERGSGNEVGESAYWSDGNRVLRTRLVNGSRSYGVLPNPVGRYDQTQRILGLDPHLTGEIYQIFTGIATNVVGRTTRNGTTVYCVVGDLMKSPESFENDWRNPRNASFRAVVDSRGLIHEYRLRYSATLDGEAIRVNQHIRYTGLGTTTIDRPPWYARAVANASTTTG